MLVIQRFVQEAGRYDKIPNAGKAKQSKAKMCNRRRHVPLCPACANEK